MKEHIPISSLKRASEITGSITKFVNAEELQQLAEKQLVPHYVVGNPLTGHKEIYFVPAEITAWWKKNCLHSMPTVEQNIKFFFFDKDKHWVKDYSNLPDELALTQGLYELPIGTINTPSGIYFLCLDKQIVYIGQAYNVAERVLQHLKGEKKVFPKKEFNRVFYLLIPYPKLDSVEQALIRYLKPPLNIAIKGKDPDDYDIKIVNKTIGNVEPWYSLSELRCNERPPTIKELHELCKNKEVQS